KSCLLLETSADDFVSPARRCRTRRMSGSGPLSGDCIPLPDLSEPWLGIGCFCVRSKRRTVLPEPRPLRPPPRHGGDVDVERREFLSEEPRLARGSLHDAPQTLLIGVDVVAERLLRGFAGNKARGVVGEC